MDLVESGALDGREMMTVGSLAQRELAGRGPGGEGGLQLAAAIGYEGAQIGSADATLAGSGPGQSGPFDQLQLTESSLPHPVQVLNGDVGARTHDSGGGTLGDGGGAGDPTDGAGSLTSHPGQGVAGIGAQAHDRRGAGDPPLAVRSPHNHRLQAAPALEAHQVALDPSGPESLGNHAHGHRLSEPHPGGFESGGGTRGEDPDQVGSGNHRVDVGGAGGHHHVGGEVPDDVVSDPGHHFGARVDGQRLPVPGGVDHHRRLTQGRQPGRLRPTASPAADDHHPAVLGPMHDPAGGGDRAGKGRRHGNREGGNRQAVSHRGLTHAPVGDAVDHRQAVRAVARHAQGSRRHLPGPDRGREDVLAGPCLDEVVVHPQPHRGDLRAQDLGQAGGASRSSSIAHMMSLMLTIPIRLPSAMTGR